MVKWILLALTLVLIPLWVLRHDLVANFKGVSWDAHINHRLTWLTRCTTFERVVGSPEWVRTKVISYLLGWLCASALCIGYWLDKHPATFLLASMLVVLGVVVSIRGLIVIAKGRAEFGVGVRSIQQVRRRK